MKRTYKALLLGWLILLMMAATGCEEPQGRDAETAFLSNDGFCGKITEYHFDDDGTLQNLSIHAESESESEGEPAWFECDMEIQLTDQTQITSDAPGLVPERFLSGEYGTVWIQGTGQKERTESGFVCQAETLALSEVLTDETVTLPEGEVLRVWNFPGGKTYRTMEGQTVLSVFDTYLADFMAYPASTLGPEARERIARYFQDQGEVYDLEEKLQQACRGFVRSGREEDYDGGTILQAPKTLGISEKYIFYDTFYSGPIGDRSDDSMKLAVTFDRISGEPVDLLSLFTLDPAEVGPTLIRMAGVEDTPVAKELLEAFRPEYILFGEDRLGLVYPPEILPSHPDTYAIWFEYDDNIKSILKPEAVPISRP